MVQGMPPVSYTHLDVYKRQDSNVIDEEKQKKIDSFNLDFSHFYVAAFQLPKDFNEFSKLKDIIKDQQIESHCFRYNNMVLTAYFCDQNSYIGPIVCLLYTSRCV